MSVKRKVINFFFLSFNAIQIMNGGVSFIIDDNAIEAAIAVKFIGIYINH